MRYFSIGDMSITEQELRTAKYSVDNLSSTRGAMQPFQTVHSSVCVIAASRA